MFMYMQWGSAPAPRFLNVFYFPSISTKFALIGFIITKHYHVRDDESDTFDGVFGGQKVPVLKGFGDGVGEAILRISWPIEDDCRFKVVGVYDVCMFA